MQIATLNVDVYDGKFNSILSLSGQLKSGSQNILDSNR